MKQITIIRHAKSDWGSEGLKDMDRPLAERGYEDAYILSKWYATEKQLPEVIITSDATRALSTAFIFLRELELPLGKLIISKGIYECHAAGLIELFSELDNAHKHVMLFGHNPGLTEVVNLLSNDLYFDNIPTCGIINIEFDMVSWKEIKNVKGKIKFHQFPKEFK